MFIVEILFELIIQLLLALILHLPGAFIRWMFTGFKKGKIKQFYSDDSDRNMLAAIFFFVLVGLIIWALI